MPLEIAQKLFYLTFSFSVIIMTLLGIAIGVNVLIIVIKIRKGVGEIGDFFTNLKNGITDIKDKLPGMKFVVDKAQDFFSRDTEKKKKRKKGKKKTGDGE
jgi:hypothetical protein